MKKISVFIWMLIAILVFGGCENSKNKDRLPNGNSSFEDVKSSQTTSFNFSTYQDCCKALTDEQFEMYQTIRDEIDEYGELYSQTLEAFSDNSIPLCVPIIGGKAMTLRNAEGLPNITLFSKEQYNLPWIWYHCVHDDAYIRIGISYPKATNNTGLSDAKTALELIKLIAPNHAMTPDNYKDYEDSWKDVYEKKFIIDGQETTCLVGEESDGRNYILFLWNDVLVSIDNRNNVADDAFLEAFSLSEYK